MQIDVLDEDVTKHTVVCEDLSGDDEDVVYVTDEDEDVRYDGDDRVFHRVRWRDPLVSKTDEDMSSSSSTWRERCREGLGRVKCAYRDHRALLLIAVGVVNVVLIAWAWYGTSVVHANMMKRVDEMQRELARRQIASPTPPPALETSSRKKTRRKRKGKRVVRFTV